MISPTLHSLRNAYASGTRPAEIIAQVYSRIAEVADDGIFISLRDQADVLKEAEALGAFDASMPLWGVPFAVKDNIDVAGLDTTAACPAYAYRPDADAFVVAKLRAAGALVIGKTNLDQFATGLVGVRSPYGVPRNAIDPAIVPGGSSSGSAVAVGHGIVTFSLGTDTAGSGRVPAALNNIVGLKPTLGAWSARGCIPACRSVETISVFALTVEDAHTVYRVAAEFDPQDAYSRKVDALPLPQAPSTPRIGIPDRKSIEFFGDDIQGASFEASVALLRDSGAQVSEIDFQPLYDVASMLYEGAWVAERYTVIEDLLKNEPEAVHPVTRQIITAAERLTAADAFRGIYRLKELERITEPGLVDLDMLCVPTIPTFYSVADLDADPIGPNSRLGTYTNFVNLLNMCALAVPTPSRSDGRPGSVTLIARAGQDHMLGAMAACLEMAGDRSLGATNHPRPARSHVACPSAGTTPIVVCGAHMSGLPLNGELTKLGAGFVRADKTTADYRFYALAGGPPYRPGLVKAGDGEGSEIDVEVWAMPTENLGAFLNSIPAPLCLGQVSLLSGAQEVGFLCEHQAIHTAQDISGYGSWRAYLAAP